MGMSSIDANRRRARLRRILGFVAFGIVLACFVIVAAFAYLILWVPQAETGCGLCGAPEMALGPGTAGETFNRLGASYHPYTFSIQSAGTGATANDLAFQLRNGTGASEHFAYVGLLDVSTCWVGSYTSVWAAGLPASPPPNATACGNGGPTLTTQVTSGDELELVTTLSVADQGYSLVLTGQGSLHETISVSIP
jgi:hypothetical protein